MSGGVLMLLSVWVRCRFAYGPADTTATHCLLLQCIQTGFTFLAPARPGSPRQRAIKQCCCCLLNLFVGLRAVFSTLAMWCVHYRLISKTWDGKGESRSFAKTTLLKKVYLVSSAFAHNTTPVHVGGR